MFGCVFFTDAGYSITKECHIEWLTAKFSNSNDVAAPLMARDDRNPQLNFKAKVDQQLLQK